MHGATLRNLGVYLCEILWLEELATSCAADGVHELFFTGAPLYAERSTGGPFNQGRYLLPIVPLAGVAAAAALTLVPGRWRARVLSLGLGTLVALQALCLAAVIGRFYA